VSKNEFYQEFLKFLRELNEGKEIQSINESDNLIELGCIDSLSLVSTVMFLEELLGEEIALEKHELRSFYTMENMYNTFFTVKVH
jgi:acyl carrier protein